MTLVVDTNVLISALIADATTRQLVRDIDTPIAAPEKLKREIEKYDDLIQEKSGLTGRELDALEERLFGYIEFVPDERLDEYRSKAVAALGEVDPDNVVFLATALAVDGAMWSDDADFREQNLVAVLDTGEVIERTGTLADR